ncbi:hypothetical protein [Xanthomonas euroxanthea]|uniref:hypothetical protein n=1 Tax=Xanthomonas euroxanthea TaxID=2259622 RepID=UPI0011C069CF|nr:hypothetical protein [Xanthomonas euroxanthea]CAE1132470.1 hypothetical protein XTG_000124 [Xanthomonas euroxanthea]
MQQTNLVLASNSSASPDDGNIIISARALYTGRCDLVIGYPGLSNSEHELRTGDAALYQAPTGETYEVRALSLTPSRGEFLITKLGAQPVLAASFVNEDPLNSPFNEDELRRIDASIAGVKAELLRGGRLAQAQLQLISHRLDEIQSAARRMGRKDWALYFAGAITSVCGSAAFAPDVTRSVFLAVGEAFSWAFRAAPNVLLLT